MIFILIYKFNLIIYSVIKLHFSAINNDFLLNKKKFFILKFFAFSNFPLFIKLKNKYLKYQKNK